MTYGIEYAPLMARVERHKKRPDDVVAFIKVGDREQLCFFERGTQQPAAGTRVEVMITSPVHPRKDRYLDFGQLTALRVQVVDLARHVLVAIDGFSQSGSMCRTLASGVITTGFSSINNKLADAMAAPTKGRMTITPGRTGVRYADHNWDSFNKRPLTPIQPTNIWAERNAATGLPVRQPNGGVRAIGLTRIEDLESAELVVQTARKAA